MNDHDPLCPQGAFLRTEERGRKPDCQCALIEAVRADEREQALERVGETCSAARINGEDLVDEETAMKAASGEL